jgi:uncharacterized membrane protein YoaT (DUF817 family)
MLALIVGTWACYPKGAWLARYDFLVVAAIAIQGVMLWASPLKYFNSGCDARFVVSGL